MYINDAELDARLNNDKDVATVARLRPTGKSAGRKNLTMEERIHIAKLSKIMGPTAAGKLANVDKMTAMHLQSGRISGNTPKVPELLRANEENNKTIRERAATLLLQTLGVITPSEISKTKIKDRVAIAKDLASINEKMTPKDSGHSTQIGNVVFMTVKTHSIKDYEKAS